MATSKFSKIFMAATLASVFSFTACGDDSSTGADEEDQNGENASSATVTETTTGKLEINEKARTLQVQIIETKSACISKDYGETYKMKALSPDTAYSAMTYDFYGDTLALYNCELSSEHIDRIDVDECSGNPMLYVGGSKGKIIGSWTFTGCVKDYGYTECEEDYDGSTVIEFDKDSYKTTETVSYEVDLGNSYFAEKMIKNIAGKYYSEYDADYLEEEGDIKHAADNYDVKIKTRSASAFAFVYDGATYAAELVNHSGNEVSDYEITVTSGKKSCKLISKVYHENAITSEICNAKNSEYFSKSYSYDKNDNEIYTVSSYKKDNEEEFDACMDRLAGLATDDDWDDYSSGRSSSSSYRSSSSSEKIVLETKIDEEEQTIVFMPVTSGLYCTTNSDHSTFKMSEVLRGSSYYEAVKYEFVKDTLAVYECNNYEYYGFSNCDDYADMFVGGKAGSIIGTWTYTGCYKYGSYTSCYTEDEIKTIEITKDGISTSVEYLTEKSNPVDLRETELMENIASLFSKGYYYYSFSADDLFYSGNYEYLLNDTLVAKDASSSQVTLTYNGHDITTKVISARENPDSSAVIVTSADTTCELAYIDYSSYEITENECKASNKDYFSYDYDYDFKDEKIYYVDEYFKSNYSSFTECLENMEARYAPEEKDDDDTGDTDVDTGDTDTGDTDVDTGDTGDTDAGDKEVNIGGEAVVDVVPDAEMVAPAPSAFKKAYKQVERRKTSKFMRSLMHATKR